MPTLSFEIDNHRQSLRSTEQLTTLCHWKSIKPAHTETPIRCYNICQLWRPYCKYFGWRADTEKKRCVNNFFCFMYTYSKTCCAANKLAGKKESGLKFGWKCQHWTVRCWPVWSLFCNTSAVCLWLARVQVLHHVSMLLLAQLLIKHAHQPTKRTFSYASL